MPELVSRPRSAGTKERERGTDAKRASFSLSDSTWASSVGGPGLNFGEHIAGRSRLGTGWFRVCVSKERGDNDAPMNPSRSRSSSGSAISALTPHTMVVFPRRTREEPFAVDIEPEDEFRSWIRVKRSPRAQRTDVGRYITPCIACSSIWSNILCKEALEVDARVEALESGGFQRFLLSGRETIGG